MIYIMKKFNTSKRLIEKANNGKRVGESKKSTMTLFTPTASKGDAPFQSEDGNATQLYI